jgi:hypothetical protein
MRKVIIMLFVVSLVFSGCAIFKGSAKEETSQPKGAVPNQVFYSFPDIPVPKELNFVREKSFIYETPMMKAGVLVLSGNVDLQSLENYFRVNMVKNGWKFVNSFKFKDISLNFVKEDKTCNIKMSREAFNADVEIWVGPSDKGSTQKANGPK